MPEDWFESGKFRSKTKNEYAFSLIREAILSGRLKPGTPLNAGEIAEKLGMSEIPVREALRQLQEQRLVKIQSHVGAFVSEPSHKEIEDNLAVREILEPIATRLATANMDEATIDTLNSILEEMERVVKNEDYLSYGVLNREFHNIIYSACPNREIHRILSGLWDISERSLGLFATVPERISQSVVEHREIIRALQKRDGDRAAEITRIQKKASFERFLKNLGKSDK
ncbi:MAG: GntR family transcriptional regulator [Desulfocucumaceae bacterium]